ncbi:MAG: hypothetical protein U0R24_11145 [Solirubrobacterales bacterium]
MAITNTDVSPPSPSVGKAVAEVPGVETVSPIGGAGALVEVTVIITGLDSNLTSVANLD